MIFPKDIDLVYQKIDTVIQSINPEEQIAAAEWLDEFQQTSHAVIIFNILLRNKPSLFKHCFAAECMRQVVQNEIPKLMHETLYISLKVHIGQSTAVASTIIELGMALINLWFQMDAGMRPFSDVMDTFSAKPKILLKVLSLIPSEIGHCTVVQNQLAEVVPLVLDFFFRCGHNTNERLLNRMLRSFGMWIKNKCIPAELLLVSSPIMNKVLHLLNQDSSSEETHEKAVQCVCHLVKHYLGCTNHFYNFDSQLMEQWFDVLCGLEGAYSRSIANKHKAKVEQFTELFTALCNAILTTVVSRKIQPLWLLKAMNVVLINIQNVNFEDAQRHYEFWIDLCYALREKENANLVKLFKPTLKRLLKLICKHMEIDVNYQGLFMVDSNIFNFFRNMAGTLVEQIAGIVGYTECFSELAKLIQVPYAWEPVESVLFLMQKVARNIRHGENNVMPEVMYFIISFHEDSNVALLYTSIQLLGALGNWLQNYPHLLPPTIAYLRNFIKTPGLNSPAAAALVSIFEACEENAVIRHLDELYTIAQLIAHPHTTSINKEQRIGLLEGISKILARLPEPVVAPILRQIVNLPLQLLNEANGAHNSPDVWIDCVGAMLRHIDPKQPAIPAILADIWLLCPQVLIVYQKDGHIVERFCHLLRQALIFAQLRNCMGNEILNSLIGHLACVYAIHYHICLVRLGTVLVELFAANPAYKETLLDMLILFVEPGFSELQIEDSRATNKPCSRSFHEFFNLCSCFISHLPLVLLESKHVKYIVQRTLVACVVGLPAVNLAAMAFLCKLLKCQRQTSCQPAVQAIVQNIGAVLLITAFNAPIRKLGVLSLTDTVDIIAELKAIVNPEKFMSFVEALLIILPKENSRGSVVVTEQDFNDLSATLLNNDINSISVAMREFINLYHN